MEESRPRPTAYIPGSNISSNEWAEARIVNPNPIWLAGTPDEKYAEIWALWKNSSHPMTRAAPGLAERWAKIMQLRIANGENPTDIFAESATVVDMALVTRPVQLLAARILHRYWVYGEEFYAGFIKQTPDDILVSPIPDGPGDILY